MVGEVWNHIPNFQYRETCQTCNTTELMEHILTRCNANTNRIVWNLAKETWPHHDTPWPEINVGLIMGIGCLNNTINIDHQDPIRRNPCTITLLKAKTRLLQILISEAAHLAWVLRCERIIQEKNSQRQGNQNEMVPENKRVPDMRPDHCNKNNKKQNTHKPNKKHVEKSHTKAY
jgi:hypothetical protein